MVPAFRPWLPRTAATLLSASLAFGAALAAPADTRVIEAVRRGDAAGVRALIQQKAPVTVAEADGTTALHVAVQRDQIEIVQTLLKAGAQANAATRYGVTPLALAAINGSPAVVGALLEAGANPNAASPEGETVLMDAAAQWQRRRGRSPDRGRRQRQRTRHLARRDGGDAGCRREPRRRRDSGSRRPGPI